MTRTMLIVDDNAIDKAALKDYLGEKYNVIEADSGAKMLSVLHKRGKEISAIVLNPALPDMDGFDALKKIRENTVCCQVPIIAVSVQKDDKTQAQAFSFGATGFITKPYNKDIIVPMLENTISLREKSAPSNTLNADYFSPHKAASKQQPSETEVTTKEQQQLLGLLNDTPSGIAIVEVDPKDLPGTLHTTYYNDRFISYSGYDRNEYNALLKNNELAFVFNEDVPELQHDIENICAGDIGVTSDTLVRCHTKEGGFRWLLLTGQLAKRRGNICVINVALIDITERQEAIDRQRISEEMLRIAAETDRRSMIVYDVKKNTCRAESRSLFSAKYGEVFENIPQSLIDMGLTAPDSEDALCSIFARIREGESRFVFLCSCTADRASTNGLSATLPRYLIPRACLLMRYWCFIT